MRYDAVFNVIQAIKLLNFMNVEMQIILGVTRQVASSKFDLAPLT